MCVSLCVLNRVRRNRQDVGKREMLPNSFSVPIAKRIRQAFGDKLPLFTSGTQRGTLTDSHTPGF